MGAQNIAVGSLMLAMLSIQYGASMAKQLFAVVGVLVVASMRTSLASALLLCLHRPWSRKIPRGAWAKILPYGASLGLMNLCFYLSIERIPLGIAVSVEFLGPLGVALAGSRRWQDVIWVALAAAGLYLIFPLHAGAVPHDGLGVLFSLAAAGFWALYIIFGQRVGRVLDAGVSTSLGMLTAAAVVLPFGLSQIHNAAADPHVWMHALSVAVLSSALPYSLEMQALKRLSAHNFGVLMSLEPALASIMGTFFLREHLNGQQWLAIGAIVLASAGSALTGVQNGTVPQAEPQPVTVPVRDQ